MQLGKMQNQLGTGLQRAVAKLCSADIGALDNDGGVYAEDLKVG